MKKCLFLMFLLVIVVVTLLVGFSPMAGTAGSDYTLQNNVFTVYTAEGLMNVASMINSNTSYSSYTINIANDIDMSGKTWVPIGKDATYAYSGTINGSGHTIRNLTALNYGVDSLAFVGVAGSGASVKNLHLKNINFHSSKRYVSGIIADVTSNASISGCSVEGKIYSGDNYAGGLVAAVTATSSNVTIENCAVNAEISAANHSAAGIVAGDSAGGQSEGNLSTFPIVNANKVFVAGNIDGYYRIASFMGYNNCANVSFKDCVSIATLNYSKASENGAFIAVDRKSKIYLENCIVFSDLHAFYYLNISKSVQTVELKNCYLLKDKIGKMATVTTYNQNGYYKYDTSAQYKYTVLADIIVDGIGPTFTPFTKTNKSYRVPIIQYNLPSGTETEVINKAYDKAMSMFTDGSVQESFVHKHVWGTGKEEVAATYMSTGITTHECSKCHAVKRVETPTKESTVEWNYNKTTKTLTISGNGSMGRFFTPNTIPWKEFRSEISSVVITKGVEDICDYAFYDCVKLKSITIPSGVKVIGAYAFHNCKALKNIVLPETVKTIHDHAFEYCSKLENINIPASLTKIGYGVFRYAKEATPVIKSDSAKYIVSGNCLIEKSTLTVIAGFSNSTIPTDSAVVTTIGRCAFQGCTGLKEITVPSNVTTVAIHAFADCTKLNKVNISANVTEISEGLFSGCFSLDNVTLPSNITKIGALAFNECMRLTNITLPSSLTSIDISAFDYCTSLQKVYFTGNSTTWANVSVAKGNEIITNKITYK